VNDPSRRSSYLVGVSLRNFASPEFLDGPTHWVLLLRWPRLRPRQPQQRGCRPVPSRRVGTGVDNDELIAADSAWSRENDFARLPGSSSSGFSAVGSGATFGKFFEPLGRPPPGL
jgi:hypothetical protein